MNIRAYEGAGRTKSGYAFGTDRQHVATLLRQLAERFESGELLAELVFLGDMVRSGEYACTTLTVRFNDIGNAVAAQGNDDWMNCMTDQCSGHDEA